jgi:branched-chain amino acid transport system ATP-binding protein
MKSNFIEHALWFGRARRKNGAPQKVEEVIDFLEIQHIRKTPVGRLPYGLQKRVELAARWPPSRRCCCSTSRWPA